MHTGFRKIIRFFLVTGILSACANKAPIEQFPDITFSHLNAFKINTAKIVVENQFHPPIKTPHIEHTLRMPPRKAMESWLKDRFQPIGSSGTLSLIIQDATVTREPLSIDKSLRGRLTKQQSVIYKMIASASLQIKDENGKIMATASASVERSLTAREDISLNDRDRLLLEMVSDLMADFNNNIEPNIYSHFKPWFK